MSGLATRVIDWVSITLKHYTTVKDVLDLFPCDFAHTDRGMHGYRSQYVAEGGAIRVLYDGGPEMGVHVQLSGDGCRFAETLENFTTWPEKFSEWQALGASVTRLDLAIDSFDPRVNVELVRGHMAARSCTTRWARTPVTDIRSISLQDGTSKGDCLYFGSASSDVRLRIYDKGAEQSEIAILVDGKREHWTRFEWQLRRERAQQVFEMLAAGLEDEAVGICRGYIEFRQYRLDSNPSMAPVAAWWEQLCAASKLILSCKKVVAECVQRMHVWIKKQVAPALAVMVAREGGDVIGALMEYISDGQTRFKQRHRLMIAASYA